MHNSEVRIKARRNERMNKQNSGYEKKQLRMRAEKCRGNMVRREGMKDRNERFYIQYVRNKMKKREMNEKKQHCQYEWLLISLESSD